MTIPSSSGKIRVLVSDDNALARRVIISLLSRDDDIIVVGEAENGISALKMVLDLKPDLVTMGMEMPVMGGLAAIEQIMARAPLPILVLTARDDADSAFAALAKGALEVMEKPRSHQPGHVLIEKIKALAGIAVDSFLHKPWKQYERPTRLSPERSSSATPSAVVAVASSTGGPRALAFILSALPSDLPAPIFVAQHMSEGFSAGMVDWLAMNSRLSIQSAAEGSEIVSGTVYVSPPERNMLVAADDRILLAERGKGDIYRPSCDTLLSSVARVYGSRSIGLVLTGMGCDGAAGAVSIRRAGGFTIAQDESSSMVFGMPKAAMEKDGIDLVLPLDKIAAELVKRLWRPFPVPAEGAGERR